MIIEWEMLEDLVLLELQDFDMILDMDWLDAHHANVDCYSKEATFHIPNRFEVVLKGT